MKRKIIGLSCVVLGILVIAYAVFQKPVTNVSANSCKSLNAECQINNSDKSCCPGLVCGDFNPESGNGKCKTAPTSTPTPTATPTPRPTSTPTPTATPTPTPHHYACNEDHECVQVKGYGDNSCNPEWDEGCQVPSPTPTPTVTQGCGDNCDVTPTPTITVTPTPEQPLNNVGSGPSGCGNNCSAPPPPQCPNGDTVKTVANFFVIRGVKNSDGTTDFTKAVVNFFITQGDSANVYWGIVGHPHWENSSAAEYPNGIKPNGENFVSYTIGGLNPNGAYEFGVQQKFGCGGGETVTSVIVDGSISKTFTYYSYGYSEWTK